jgi:hypothetical protein
MLFGVTARRQTIVTVYPHRSFCRIWIRADVESKRRHHKDAGKNDGRKKLINHGAEAVTILCTSIRPLNVGTSSQDA